MEKVDAAQVAPRRCSTPAAMEAALAALPGVTRDDAAGRRGARARVQRGATRARWSTLADDLYVFDFVGKAGPGLTAAARRGGGATFSPDGRRVAFVREQQPVRRGRRVGREQRADDRRQRRSCSTASSTGSTRKRSTGAATSSGYWWSPDSSRLAFLQLDETPVPEYTVVDHIPYRPALEVTDYPKAGDPNPTVQLGVVRVAGGGPVVGRPSTVRRHRVPDRRRRLDARLARRSCTRCRTASRPGST